MTDTRRAHGEGSLATKPRADGLWTASLLLPNGRRKYFYGHSKAEARKKLNEAKRQVDQGLAVGTTIKLDKYLDLWLERVAKPKVRPRTYDYYADYIARHIAPELGGYRLTMLRPLHIEDFLARKRKAGLAPRTLHHLRAILRNALNSAVRWELIRVNPAALTEPVSVPKEERSPMTVARVREILGAVKGDAWESIYVLAVATGLRKSELLGLTWSEVDLDAGTIGVRRQLQRRERAYSLVQPKTAPSRRAIPLPIDVVEMLQRHQAAQQTWREARTDPATGEVDWRNEWDLVFTYVDGAPVAHASVSHHLHEIMDAAGLPRLRFHDLRVAHNTVLTELGVDLAVRMARLGHTVMATNLDYTTQIPSAQRDATDRLTLALWGAKSTQ